MANTAIRNPNPAPRRITAIFAKQPVPGTVKTRLCPPLAPAQAAALAQAMLSDVLEDCLQCPEFHTALCCAPPEAFEWFRTAFPEVADLRKQEGEGLAQRLAGFFESELTERPGSTAVVLGSDAPLVGIEPIIEGHRALERGADLVLGPDNGGGYYLVGLREPNARLFTDIEMSTKSMRDETVKLAEELGLKVVQLEPNYDIDVGDDLRRLRGELSRMQSAGTATWPVNTARVLTTIYRD